MTRQMLWLVGGGVAVLVLAAVLTVIPVKRETGMSTVVHIDAAAAHTPDACVDTDFDATFEYSVVRPLIDVWGYVRVEDLTVDHVVQRAVAGSDCYEVEEVTTMQSWVVFGGCDGGASEAAILVQSGSFSDCDGHAMVFAAAQNEGMDDVTMRWEGEHGFADLGIVRGPVCPEIYSQVSYSTPGTAVSSDALPTGPTPCLDLS